MTPRNTTTGQVAELFPGQLEHEEILIFIRRHWMPFMGWLGVTLILLLLPVFSVVILKGIGVNGLVHGRLLVFFSVGVGTHLLLTGAVFLTGWVEHYLAVSIITTDRLVTIRQVGLFNRRVAELSILRVQDVSAQIRGYLQSLLRYGDVRVETAGDVPNFIMRNVPQPHVIAHTILMLHDRLAMENREGQTGGIRLPRKIPMSKPPHDYDHAHFNEDLLTQARETKEHLEREHSDHSSNREVKTESPNRLPPRSQSGSRGEGELIEGKSISLQ